MPDSSSIHSLTLALGLPGGWEWFVILIIGVLLFGKRLPDVAKGLGRSIVEFKKGIKGVEDEIETSSSEPSKPAQRLADRSAEQPPRPRTDEPVPTTVQREPGDRPQ